MTFSSIRRSMFGVRLSAFFLAVCLLAACAPGPVSSTSPAAVLGHSLSVDAAQAVQAYVDIKAGNADMAWALVQGLAAEQNAVKTAADIRVLVKAWTGNTGDSDKLADRLARIFGDSSGPPASKTAALMAVVSNVSVSNRFP